MTVADWPCWKGRHRMIIDAGAKPIIWSPPDGRCPNICSRCFGSLDEVPLIIWSDDGRMAKLCDDCVAQCVRSERPA